MPNRKNVNPLNYVPLDNTWSPQGNLNPINITIENYGQNTGCGIYSNGLYQWKPPKLAPINVSSGMKFSSCDKK